MDHLIIALASALSTSALVAIIGKWAINKVLNDLSRNIDKVNDLYIKLAVHSEEIKKIAEHDAIIKEHDRDISYLKGIYRNGKASVSHHSHL